MHLPSDETCVVTLRVPEALDARVVLALRRVVPELPPIGSGPLLAKLRRSRTVVLGTFAKARADEMLRAARAEGLSLDARPARIDRASLVLESLVLAPLGDCERPAIEAVFAPAFAPEVVVRITGTEAPRLMLATCGVSIESRLCAREPWLEPPYDAPSRPPLAPSLFEAVVTPEARHAIDAALDVALLERDDAVGLDGMCIWLRRVARTGAQDELCTWSPAPGDRPERYAAAFEILRVADDHVDDARALGIVSDVMESLGLAPDEDFVGERDLDAASFHCCGDEDLLPFRCVSCRRLMVLCYECDTLYPDLDDTRRRARQPAACLGCGASTADVAASAAHRSRRPAWRRAGLEKLLRPR